MIKIRRSLGLLAAVGIATASVMSGTALAATHATVPTKAEWKAAMSQVKQPSAGCFRASYPALRWNAVKCVTAPKVPLVPNSASRPATRGGPDTVGDGTDYSAVVSGKITKAVGTFTGVTSGITEKGQNGGEGGQVANAFSLQLNSQFFSGSPACAKARTPADCEAWQQFVYTYESSSEGYIFMQYWLIDYDNTCPSGWYTYSTDCYTNSNAATTSVVTAAQLGSTTMTATAASGGNDAVSLTTSAGKTTSVSNADTKVDLASYWNTTEWGVYGDGGGSAANFSANASLEAVTALTDGSSTAPSCVKEGFTGETNNLTLTATPSLGSRTSPTMGSKQTDGTKSTASCATAAG